VRAAVSTERKAALLLSLTMLCYASNHVIGRAVHVDVPPLGLSFWRWLCGAAILFPFIVAELKRLLPLYAEHWRILMLLGALIVGSTTLVLVGLNFTSATNTSLINASQPTLTALLCWIFLKDKLAAGQWCGIALAFAGITAILARGDIGALRSLEFNAGDLLVLLAMLGFATYGINIRKIPAQFHVTESLFAIIVLGLLLLLPFYVAESMAYKTMPANTETAGVVIALALLVSVAGMSMWTRGNQLIGPNRAAVYVNLLPLFGTVLAIIFLSEQVQLHHILGGAMICAGMWLALKR
jgi:drug/metabolite transporter (DMT)-like permease